MAMIAEWLTMDEERVVSALQEARRTLDNAEGEIVLDFSWVRRVHPSAIRAMQDLADTADANAAKVALRGVNVDVYKALKLVKLASRFSFVTSDARSCRG